MIHVCMSFAIGLVCIEWNLLWRSSASGDVQADNNCYLLTSFFMRGVEHILEPYDLISPQNLYINHKKISWSLV